MDRSLAARLTRSFQDVGFVVHGDWDLPAGAPYPEVLSEWIAAANIFAILLCPEYFNSPECQKELRRARDLGKRLAPILIRQVNVVELPSDVRSIQWAPLEADSDFKATVELLKDDLERDLPWEREFNRLTERALNWEKRGRTIGPTLRRDDLRAAEDWLSRTITEPNLKLRLTDLVIQFIRQSQKAERRLRTVVLSSVVVGLAIALSLALYALGQSSQRTAAEKQRRAAAELAATKSAEAAESAKNALMAERGQEQAKEEAAREAASAEVQRANAASLAVRERGASAGLIVSIPGRATDGLQAAIQAIGMADADKLPRYPQVLQALTLAVSAGSESLALCCDGKNVIDAVDFSVDGQMVAAAGRDAFVRLWSSATGELLMQWQHPNAGKNGVFGIAFSSQGGKLATVPLPGVPLIWDTSQKGVRPITPKDKSGAEIQGWYESVRFAHKHKWLVAAGFDRSGKGGLVTVWNEAGEWLFSKNFSRQATFAEYSPTDDQIAISFSNGETVILDANLSDTVHPKQSLTYPNSSREANIPIATAFFSPSGDSLVTALAFQIQRSSCGIYPPACPSAF